MENFFDAPVVFNDIGETDDRKLSDVGKAFNACLSHAFAVIVLALRF